MPANRLSIEYGKPYSIGMPYAQFFTNFWDSKLERRRRNQQKGEHYVCDFSIRKFYRMRREKIALIYFTIYSAYSSKCRSFTRQYPLAEHEDRGKSAEPHPFS
jgi:hypothetical protein